MLTVRFHSASTAAVGSLLARNGDLRQESRPLDKGAAACQSVCIIKLAVPAVS